MTYLKYRTSHTCIPEAAAAKTADPNRTASVSSITTTGNPDSEINI